MQFFRVAILAVAVTALLVVGIGAPTLTTYIDPFTTMVAMAAVGVRAERVIPLFELPDFLGVRRSQIAEAVKHGQLHPFTPLGGRRKVVLESEVAALQARAMAEAAAAAEAMRVAPATSAPARRKRKTARATAVEPTLTA